MDVWTSRLCRELGLLNGRHFDVVRFEKDDWFQRSRPKRGGTVRQQTTRANRDHLYPIRLSGFSASGQFSLLA